MALFKLRKGGDEPVAPAAQTESVEAMRRRARHRLIGAAVLVLVGVVGFPLLFDTQPRPIAVDIPIEIPDRNKVKPLAGRREVPTRVLDEDTYPVGGFTSLSTKGTVESLLQSQLAYMEREPELRPDLFDVKYVRDELYYYSRDENQFLRRRRTFVFCLVSLLVPSSALATWSVIAVDSAHRRVLPNPLKRYLLNKETNPQYGQDGSLTLYFADARPKDAPDGNWLPTPKGIGDSLTFRFYRPKEAVAERTYFPPPLVKQ